VVSLADLAMTSTRAAIKWKVTAHILVLSMNENTRVNEASKGG